MDKDKCVVCYLTMVWVLYFIYSIVLCVIGNQLRNQEDTHVDFIRQITTDWTAVPFVNIEPVTTSVDQWACPDGTSAIY